MVRVFEWYDWDVEVSGKKIVVRVMFKNDILYEILISHCEDACETMLATNEHDDTLQNVLLNFAQVLTTLGKIIKERYTIEIEYDREEKNE